MHDTTHHARSQPGPDDGQAGAEGADLVIRRTTVATVLFLAAVAALVSYGHIHTLALRHGEEPWTAALLPLSVDGMIVAASMALLSDSRRGRRGGVLPWALLAAASSASLAANVAAADPAPVSRVIAAWPPFALIGAYEMLMRQIRHSVSSTSAGQQPSRPGVAAQSGNGITSDAGHSRAPVPIAVAAHGSRRAEAERLQRQAWQWAHSHRRPDGGLPSGEAIAAAFQRSPRWGRLVKQAGLSGHYGQVPSGQEPPATQEAETRYAA